MLGGGRLTSHDRRKFLLDHDESIDIFTNVMCASKQINRPPLKKNMGTWTKVATFIPSSGKNIPSKLFDGPNMILCWFSDISGVPYNQKKDLIPNRYIIPNNPCMVYITIHLSSLGTFHVGILTHIYQHHFSPFGYVDPPPKRTYRAPFTHPRLTLPGGHSKELALSIASGTPKGAIKHGAAWRIHGKWYIIFTYMNGWFFYGKW